MKSELFMGIAFQIGQILWDFISQCEIWHVWKRLTQSADPGHMLQNAASDQGLHYLPLVQQFVETLDSKMDLLKFLDKYDKLKVRYSSKKKTVFIQERFNKLI